MHRLKTRRCTCSTSFLSIREVAVHSARPIFANLDSNCSISNANILNILISQVPYGVPVDAERHFDFDAVFFTALLYLKVSVLVRLAIDKNTIPELFEPGDIVFIDPRVEHCVEELARGEDRQVIVFTF